MIKIPWREGVRFDLLQGKFIFFVHLIVLSASVSYASLGISLVNYLPVTHVIIIEHSLFTSKQETMVPVNVVTIEG